MIEYERRSPEKSLLYKVISKNMNSFFSTCDGIGDGLPYYVKKEFEKYLECGIPAYGFLRVKCDKCKKEDIVSFSCKGRGICPSCSGRRMNEKGARIIDEILPMKDVRQWVISFPHRLRYLMSTRPKVITKVLKICVLEIERIYKEKGKRSYGVKKKDQRVGMLTLVQRFGSALNLNVHFHILAIEGVFSENKEGAVVYYKTPKIEEREVECVLKKIIKKVSIYLSSLEEDWGIEERERLLSKFKDGSVRQFSVLGNRRVRGIFYEIIDGEIERKGKLCYHCRWFSIHAGTYIRSRDRSRVEKLVRYVLRPSITSKRLKELPSGDLSYELKTPWHNGMTHVVFSPMEFMEKLSALVPPPRANIIRYSGVLAPNSKFRKRVVNQSEKKSKKKKRGFYIEWAELLKRVFQVDVLKCPYCGSQGRKVIAAVQDGHEIKRYLRHIGVSSDPPLILEARTIPLEFEY